MHIYHYKGPYTFSIGDTTGFSDYVKGGVAVQVKMPRTFKFVRNIIYLFIYLMFYVLEIN